MTYVDKAEKFINRWGMITHRKIMQITGCNCPYSVLASLKRKFEFDVKEKKTTTGKKYNLYIVRKKAA